MILLYSTVGRRDHAKLGEHYDRKEIRTVGYMNIIDYKVPIGEREAGKHELAREGMQK